ncbi:MAG: hypothetical protein ACOCXX_05795 [Planctomycetota bacterium]
MATLKDQLAWLTDLMHATVEACRVAPGEDVPGCDLCNRLDVDVYLPGSAAGEGYRSWWLRDFVMSVPAMDLSAEYLAAAARHFAGSQRPEDWHLVGGLVPAWFPSEKINLDGGYSYYPGSYRTDDTQAGMWGPRPPMDSVYCFIELVWLAWKSGARDLPAEQVGGVSMLERMVRAYDAVLYDEATGLAVSSPIERSCDFGFTDTVYKVGRVLFGSVMAARACTRIEQVARSLDEAETARRFASRARRIRENIPCVFGTPDGLLNAATEVCCQPDVWGTAFAVYAGAVEGEVKLRACRALVDAWHRGTIVRDGAVRHLRTTDDWTDHTSWQFSRAAYGTYQDGGYWLTPSGWVIYAMSLVDPDAARHTTDEMVEHMKATDFRADPSNTGPVEWHNPDNGTVGHAVNLTSAAGPLEALERIRAEGLWS